MPVTRMPGGESQWQNISVPTEEAVTPYRPLPDWAANGIEKSLLADQTAGDPLLTECTIDTWVGTMLIFISRMLGETKWKYYKNLVRHILDNSYYSEHTGQKVDPRADGSVLDFLAQNHRVCYLHNDLARQLGYLPVFPNLPPVDEEMKILMERISDVWGRDLRIENGQPITRNGDRVGRENDEDFQKEACLVALKFLQNWEGKTPARGRGVSTLLAAFGGMRV